MNLAIVAIEKRRSVLIHVYARHTSKLSDTDIEWGRRLLHESRLACAVPVSMVPGETVGAEDVVDVCVR